MTTKFNAAGHGYDTYDSTKQQFAAVANRHGIQWSWEYPGIFVFVADGVEWATGPNGWDYATRWDGSGELMQIGDESDTVDILLAKFDAMLAAVV